MRLENKVAIVTGGNSGVGAATALLFAKEGAKVVISARRLPQLEEVAEQIRAEGGEVLIVQTDVSKNEDAVNLVAKTVEVFGKVIDLIFVQFEKNEVELDVAFTIVRFFISDKSKEIN